MSTLLLASLWVVIWAAAAAVTLNLPVAPELRLLLLFVGLWAFWVIRSLHDITERLIKLERRPRRDPPDERRADAKPGLAASLAAEGDVWAALLGVIGFLAAVGLMLHYAVFGPFAAGWLATIAG